MAHEVDTTPILHDLFAHGQSVFVPLVLSATEMTMVQTHSLAEIRSFPKNKWGIPEPCSLDGWSTCFEVGGLDLVIVPALAFDPSGRRIGYGRG